MCGGCGQNISGCGQDTTVCVQVSVLLAITDYPNWQITVEVNIFNDGILSMSFFPLLAN